MLPKHIAFIPDGNRRWAKKHNLPLEIAYDKGINNFTNLSKYLHKKKEIKYVTIWSFSTENMKRDEKELDILFGLFKKYLVKGLEEKVKEEVNIRFVGNLSLFPGELVKLMHQLEKRTATYEKYYLTFLMGYGGREEIIHCIRSLISENVEPQEINEVVVSNHLYTAGLPDPDLIIRTSGEKRLSGFLPWQSVYSELYFSEKLWPEFSASDLDAALKDYEKRKRRFGR